MADFKDNSECALHIESKICTPDYLLKKFDQESSPDDILTNLKRETNCSTELCVILSEKAKHVLGYDLIDNLLENNFKIRGPKTNVNAWLADDEIDTTLIQWKKKFPIFYPLRYQMRDFEDKNTELNTINIPKIIHKYKYIACVPNTDWSTGKGQHWFALFFDFSKEPYTLEYYNSSGELPLFEFNDWLNRKEDELSTILNKQVKKIIVTRIQHQYDNSSCGCYALYYIYSRLHGIPYKWFSDNIVKDAQMHEFRKFVFNPQ